MRFPPNSKREAPVPSTTTNFFFQIQKLIFFAFGKKKKDCLGRRRRRTVNPMASVLPFTAHRHIDGGQRYDRGLSRQKSSQRMVSVEHQNPCSATGFEQEMSTMDEYEGPLFASLEPEPSRSFPPRCRRSHFSIHRRPLQEDESTNTIGAGLRNLGNTCFLNAVLQCLTHTPPFVHSLRNCDHKTPCGNEGFCALCALREHVNLSLSSSGRVIEPSCLVDNLSCISSSFRKWQQEDAHEYMHCLLEVLHSCALGSQPSNPCLFLQGESFVKKIFGGLLRSQIKCMNCSHCSDTLEPLIDLSLEIDGIDCLESALKSFTKVESIDSGFEYDCGNCKQGVSVVKQLTVDQAPDVLLIQLKRFTNDGIFGEKICTRVEYPRVLDLKPFVNNAQTSEGELKYELYAVLVHSGVSLSFGHYYCFVRSSPNAWYELDDSEVHRTSEETALDQQAYILFYSRQGIPWFLAAVEAEKDFHKVISSPKSVLEKTVPTDESNFPRGDSSGNSSDVDIVDISDNRNLTSNQEREPRAVDERVSTVLGKRNSESPDIKSIPSQDLLKLVKYDLSHIANSPALPVPSSILNESALTPKEASQSSQTDKNMGAIPRPIRMAGLDFADANEFSRFEEGARRSFTKVLKNMPGVRRACLLACAPSSDVGTSKSIDTARKRVSPCDDSLDKRQKQKHMISKSGVWNDFAPPHSRRDVLSVRPTVQQDRRTSSEGLSSNSFKKDSVLDDDDPYSLDFEIEQSPSDVIERSIDSKEARANNGFRHLQSNDSDLGRILPRRRSN